MAGIPTTPTTPVTPATDAAEANADATSAFVAAEAVPADIDALIAKYEDVLQHIGGLSGDVIAQLTKIYDYIAEQERAEEKEIAKQKLEQERKNTDRIRSVDTNKGAGVNL